MSRKTQPVLHRNDPSKGRLIGHVKVTRQDWLNLACDVLVREGVAQVKVLGLSRQLGVSRSSFYGYFNDRSDLLDALLEEWEIRNTSQIVTHCNMPAHNITEAVCNFFRCFISGSNFDRGLDFAIREWSRRDNTLRSRIDIADQLRIDAVTKMFKRHGYKPKDADARARILYFMQLGYHALDIKESIDKRMSRLKPYLLGFTGRDPDAKAVAEFLSYVADLELT